MSQDDALQAMRIRLQRLKFLQAWYSGSRKKIAKLLGANEYLMAQIAERDKAINALHESSEELLQMISNRDNEIDSLKRAIKAADRLMEVAA